MRSRLRISPILAAPVPAKVQSLNIQKKDVFLQLY